MGASTEPDICCSLGAGDVEARLVEWEAALAPVATRNAIPGGLRLTFAAGASLDALLPLVVAEQACCPFVRFAVTVDERGSALEVTAPDGAAEIVTALFGG